MPANSKLFHKLLLLVAVPLAFEVGFATMLLDNLASSEASGAREHRAREAIASLSSLYERITDTSKSVAQALIAQKNAPSTIDFHKTVATIPGDLENLKEQLHDDQRGIEAANLLENSINAALRILDDVFGQITTGHRLAALQHLRDLKGTIPELTAQLNRLQDRCARIADDNFEENTRSRRNLRNLILVGIALNIGIAALLVAFINRNITNRLSVVMENTRRLTKRQALLPDVSGTDEIAHLDNVFKDMTVALETARQKEQEIERVKQEFVAMISHDLRTPLTSIQVFLNSLSKGMLGQLDERIHNKAATADRNVSRLINLINNLLDIEKMESGQLALSLETVGFHYVVERALDSVEPVAEKQTVMIDATACGDARIYADGDRLVQVMVNLLGNAVKFSQPGGVVTITADDDDAMLTVKVTDQGRGIPEQGRETIFQRFKQVEPGDGRQNKGTGLGLAICKAIVEQHGGSIGVQSREGGGSTFWFCLPKIPKETTVAQPSLV